MAKMKQITSLSINVIRVGDTWIGFEYDVYIVRDIERELYRYKMMSNFSMFQFSYREEEPDTSHVRNQGLLSYVHTLDIPLLRYNNFIPIERKE